MSRLIPFIFLIVTIQVYAQSKPKIYKLTILDRTGQTKACYLRDLNDSTIIISPQPLPASEREKIFFKDIVSIKIRNRKSLWQGPIIGAGGGAILGAIIGYASYNEPVCSGICVDFGPEGDALGGAVIGVLSGGLVGLIVGSSSKKIQLKPNSDSYKSVAENLRKYVVHLE